MDILRKHLLVNYPELQIDYLNKGLEVILNILKQNDIAVIQMSTTPHPDDTGRSAVLNIMDGIIEASAKAHGNNFIDLKTPFKRVLAANQIRKPPR